MGEKKREKNKAEFAAFLRNNLVGRSNTLGNQRLKCADRKSRLERFSKAPPVIDSSSVSEYIYTAPRPRQSVIFRFGDFTTFKAPFLPRNRAKKAPIKAAPNESTGLIYDCRRRVKCRMRARVRERKALSFFLFFFTWRKCVERRMAFSREDRRS